MVTNLFSVFDPRRAILSLSWIILLILPLTVPKAAWKPNSPASKAIKKVLGSFYKEVKFTLKKEEKGLRKIAITLFFSILLMNFLALYPQVFSVTSHLTVTLPLSLISWGAIVIFGWAKNTNHILAHLVPQGTPNALISFIVLIEIVRNLIRPVTLCVRLTANLIAGHLLISLLGNSLIRISALPLALGIIAPLTLTILESAVACIQAYVFITLVTLYITEVKYDKKIQPLSPGRRKTLTTFSLKWGVVSGPVRPAYGEKRDKKTFSYFPYFSRNRGLRLMTRRSPGGFHARQTLRYCHKRTKNGDNFIHHFWNLFFCFVFLGLLSQKYLPYHRTGANMTPPLYPPLQPHKSPPLKHHPPSVLWGHCDLGTPWNAKSQL